MISIVPLLGIPIIKEGDELGKIILESYKKNNLEVEEKDILVIAQTIISRAEGRIINSKNIEASHLALSLAEQSNKNPRIVEIILRESKNICKFRNGVLVTETKHGFVCANSGVDKSNVPGEDYVSLLPINPDKSAQKLRKELEKETGKKIAIIISDTHNRPFRLGAINVAIGCSGIEPLLDYTGKDLKLFH